MGPFYFFVRQKLPGDDLHCTLSRNDAIYRAFSERIERSVGSSHEIRLQEVPAVAVVLKFALIQLHWQVGSLEVKRYHLATGVPKYLKGTKSHTAV